MRSLSYAVSLASLVAFGLQESQGSTPALVADGQVALASGFQLPQGVAISRNGTIYVADTGNNRVATVSITGAIGTVTVPGYTLSGPGAVALDASGDLFIADSNNARVLELKTGGSVVQVAGSQTLSYPACLAFDPQGNLYIGDPVNLAVYEVSHASLMAGSGVATALNISNVSGLFPGALATDNAGDLYIADDNSNNIYEVPFGQMVAQNVTPSGFTLNSPFGLGFDAAGDLYILDSGNTRIVEVPPPSAGSAPYLVPGTGFAVPSSLALDGQGNLYVTDVTNNNLTQLVYAGNAINLGNVAVGLKGSPATINYELNAPETLTAFQLTMQGDPTAEASLVSGSTCQFQSYTVSPVGSGNPITATNPFDCVAQVQAAPAVSGMRDGAVNLFGPSNSLLASVPLTETGVAAAPWIVPGVASTAISGLSQPQGFAISGENGTVYIADQVAGQVYSWKGLNGTSSTLTAVSTSPLTLIGPSDVKLDGAGDLFIADFSLGKIAVVPANTAIAPYYLATDSVLNHPTTLAFDSQGNLYIGDAGPAGFSASASQPGYVAKIPPAGGPISVLNFSTTNVIYPQALAADPSGDLYIADGGDAQTLNGQVVEVPASGAAPSPLNIANLSDPAGLAFDPAGNLWLIDGSYLNQLTIVPSGGGTPYAVPLVAPNLSEPSLMAFTAGAKGLLISDIGHGGSGANELIFVSGLQALLSFPQTALMSQSTAQTAAVFNIGNSVLTQATSTGGPYASGGNTRDFAVQTSSSCFGLPTLAPPQSCFSATFAPLEAGVESEVITSNFNSAAQVQLLLAGATTGSSSVTAPPTISPSSATLATAPLISITDTTAGATIYYTTDGSTPTTSSSVYRGAFAAEGSNPLVVNAIAVASGYSNSPVSSATYTYGPYLGTNAYSSAGGDNANYINATYAVAGNSSAGYTVNTCSFYQPTGTVTAGAAIDCGLILAPTPRTQSSSWLCHGTYMNPAPTGIGGWVTVPLAGCGTLAPNTAYWVATDSNEAAPNFPMGFWNCGGNCSGSAPTTGTGTYPYRYIAATYGVYTGMGTAMTANTSGYQASQYATLGINTPYQTATPAFSVAAGNYATAQTVAISDATSGATIYYTTDGSVPTTSSSVYQSAITVAASTTINALAVAPGYTVSQIASAAYTFSPYLGTNAYSTAATDNANYINATYAVTGSSGSGYTATSCSFYQPTGTVTPGAKLDCGLILAPTPTTQSSSWLCHGTYTNPSGSGLGGWITVQLSGCGTLPANTAYWIALDSNDTQSAFPYGVWNCGGTCSGSAPTSGTGTYPYRYIAATYGQYTGMGTAMNGGSTAQGSQFVTLGVNSSTQAAIPTLSPGTGTYLSQQAVSISDTTTGAVIYYTVDGTTPTTSSTVYRSPLTLSSTTTVNAIAVATGYSNSIAASATYTFHPSLGTTTYSTASTDYASYINATYAVTDVNAHGYTVSSCSFYQPTGTVTKGAKMDCGLVRAPTPTTQASSWLCHATYTNPTKNGAGAWITVTLSGCGTLPASTAYWVATDSNDPIAGFPYGDWNCGGACSGSVPTIGTGTYPYYYIAATYGTYTGMATAMTNSGAGYQASQYTTLTAVP
jgi:sugar lactone lactonase YvrE